jgi:hypothetical protein
MKKVSAADSERVDIRLVNAGTEVTEGEVRRLLGRLTIKKAVGAHHPPPPEDPSWTKHVVEHAREIIARVDWLNAVLRGELNVRFNGESKKGDTL